MMLATLAFVVAFGQADAPALLREVRDHYRSMKRFEATIDHHDSSGLFPGEYTQKLVWEGKGTFTLKVTKPSQYVPSSGNPGGLAPDYTADGKSVVSVWKDGRERTDSVTPRPNTSPGWEVSGGLAISFLQETNTASWILEPPKEFPLSWAMGKESSWKGLDVRQLVGTFQGHDRRVHVYVDSKRPLIVGQEVVGSTNGWMLYREIKAE